MTEVELRDRIKLDAGVLGNPLWEGRRITDMINDAQSWLQQKLIKQGFKNWRKYDNDNATIAVEVNLDLNCLTAPLPIDRLIDSPIQFRVGTDDNGDAKVRVIDDKDPDIIHNIIDNPVLTPSVGRPIAWIIDETVYVYPVPDDDTVRFSYTKAITPLAYGNSTTESEIPDSHIEIVIERCVMQIKSIVGQENVKQAKLAEIDRQLSTKYQLDRVKSVTDEKGEISK